MKIIPPDQLEAETGIRFSNPHRLELEQRGEFPRRVKLGARRYGYIDEEIYAWMKRRAALREAAA